MVATALVRAIGVPVLITSESPSGYECPGSHNESRKQVQRDFWTFSHQHSRFCSVAHDIGICQILLARAQQRRSLLRRRPPYGIPRRPLFRRNRIKPQGWSLSKFSDWKPLRSSQIIRELLRENCRSPLKENGLSAYSTASRIVEASVGDAFSASHKQRRGSAGQLESH
jgi:hypothetical protein